MDSTQALAQLEAQGTLKPGEEGWWKVWGAKIHDARKGDLILSNVDGEVVPTLVEDTFKAKAYPMRAGIVCDGARCTFGALSTIVLLRRGTKNTLA